MLDFTRAAAYEPGTNLRGEQADTTWLFVLSSLELERVVLIGLPTAGTVTTLALLGAQVLLAGAGARERGRAQLLATRHGANVVDIEEAREAIAEADLVCLTARGVAEARPDEALAGSVRRCIERGGAVYAAASDRTRGLVGRLGIEHSVVLGPGDPVSDGATGWREEPSAWLIPSTSTHQGRVAATAARARRVLGRAGVRMGLGPGVSDSGSIGVEQVNARLGRRLSRECGVLLRATPEPPTELPAWVRAAARSNGADLDGRGWSLAPPRGYPSQKVIFFVREPGGERVAEVVKATQQARFNDRLENEFRVLRALADEGLELEGAVVPRPSFLAQHAGLAVVGQTAIAGEPFRAVSSGAADCPWARRTIDALIGLAAPPREPRFVPASEAAAVLADLLGRYCRIHQPPPAHRDFLGDLFGELGESGSELPVVFMHGDPTTLNLIATSDERVGFVDWENAETRGMPLWDLFYFVEVYGQWAASLRGVRYTPGVFRSRLLEPTDLSRLLGDAVERYKAAVGVPAAAVAPLFYGFWMYRALREARQHAPSAVGDGTYTRILHTSIEQRRARGPAGFLA